MPEFYKIYFDADELEALRRGCALQCGREDRLLDEAASGSLEEVIDQENKADDMQLIRGTVSIFKPGEAILITVEDLLLVKKCLEGLTDEPAKSAIKKIDETLRHPP
jgi:hypothetical protein